MTNSTLEPAIIKIIPSVTPTITTIHKTVISPEPDRYQFLYQHFDTFIKIVIIISLAAGILISLFVIKRFGKKS